MSYNITLNKWYTERNNEKSDSSGLIRGLQRAFFTLKLNDGALRDGAYCC